MIGQSRSSKETPDITVFHLLEVYRDPVLTIRTPSHGWQLTRLFGERRRRRAMQVPC